MNTGGVDNKGIKNTMLRLASFIFNNFQINIKGNITKFVITVPVLSKKNYPPIFLQTMSHDVTTAWPGSRPWRRHCLPGWTSGKFPDYRRWSQCGRSAVGFLFHGNMIDRYRSTRDLRRKHYKHIERY